MDAVDFVPNVYRMMLANDWKLGAAYQLIWRSSPANQLVGRARDGQGTNGPLRIIEGSMDWALQFQTVRDAYNHLKRPDVFASAKARPEIQALAEKRFRSEPSKTEVGLGNFAAKGLNREPEFINHRDVAKLQVLKLDDLTAALGRATLFVIPAGTAKRIGSKTQVTITKVGIYFRDSFDFAGEQPLGWWRLPDQVSTHSPDRAPLDSELRCSTAWFGMSNRVYREYRARTGFGGDFLIYSDVKEETLASPVLFTY